MEHGGVDRRTVLASAVTVLSTLGGCHGGSSEGGVGTPERPWTSSDPSGYPEAADDLTVANLDDDAGTAWLRVVREDGTVLVDGRFELPPERGFVFESIAARATAYTIELAVGGGDVIALEWYAAECGPEAEATGEAGSRDAFVRIDVSGEVDEDDVTLVADQCDLVHRSEVPVESPGKFRLDG